MTENLIKMPELGEGVTEGELVQWLVSKGDPIKTDQTVAEVMTDKAVMEIPSPVEGVVASFCAKKGDSIPVGQPLLTLMPKNQKTTDTGQKATNKGPKTTDTGQKATNKGPKTTDTGQKATNKGPKTTDTGQKATNTNHMQTSKTKDFLASPFLRRWAKERNIDLSQISGSGPSGRIQQADVMQHSKITTGAPSTDSLNNPTQQGFKVPEQEGQERQKLKGIRKKIAEKMQASKAVIPHFTLLESAEVDQLEQLKESVKKSLKEKHIKVTYLSFVMKALLQTIKEFPTLNASIDDFSQEMVIKHYYHFGFAVDTPKGLLVPVIKNVNKKSLTEISHEIQTLAEKARQGNMAIEDMKGGTITITNIGSLGGEYATPIINAPESTILGMYRVFVKACWNGSAFVPKKTMNFSLTCDHRLIDGAVSARALQFFIHKIENPLSLFIK